jgi:hypothetical protein
MKLLEWIGVVLLVVGAILAIYFGFVFDASVPVDGEDGRRVVNLGLMNDRVVGVVCGFIGIVAGGALMVVGHVTTTRAARPRCPYCQGVIEELALVCSHCRKDQPRGSMRGFNVGSKPVPDQVEEWYRSNGGGA